MRARPSVLRVLLSVLVLSELAVAPAVAGQSATDGSVSTSALQGDGAGSVDALRERVRTERAVLDDLLAEMIEEDRLYARLTGRQTDRAVLRAEAEERVPAEERAMADLERYDYPAQDKPDRIADLAYDLQRSVETVDDLRVAVDEERQVVEQLRGRVEAENATLSRLRTPLATALARQRETQLDGLALLNESLVEQEERLEMEREFQVDRAEYARFYSEIWRETETRKRERVLANISADFERAAAIRTLENSQFESQRLGVALLWEHHRARMETVEQYRTLLASLERDLETLGDSPSPAEVERVRARLDDRAAEVTAVRTLLVNESDVAGRLRTATSAQAGRYEAHALVQAEQHLLLRSTTEEARPVRLQRTLAAVDEAILGEGTVLDALQDGVGVQRRLVGELYGVGSDLDVDPRLLAYLRVRDRIADLLLVNLDAQTRSLDVQRSDLRSKERAVARLQDARDIRDYREQLPWVIETFRGAEIGAAVLRERFEDEREVLGWLTDLRNEADLTLESEVELLDSLGSDLAMVAVETPAEAGSGQGNATTATGTPTSTPAPATSASPPGNARLVLASLAAVALGLLVWLVNPPVPGRVRTAAAEVERGLERLRRAVARVAWGVQDTWRSVLDARPGVARAWRRVTAAWDAMTARRHENGGSDDRGRATSPSTPADPTDDDAGEPAAGESDPGE